MTKDNVENYMLNIDIGEHKKGKMFEYQHNTDRSRISYCLRNKAFLKGVSIEIYGESVDLLVRQGIIKFCGRKYYLGNKLKLFKSWFKLIGD